MSTGTTNTNYSNTQSSKVSLIFSGDYAAADEGSYFVVTNPTPGTPIATTTSVVDDATGATTHAQTLPTMLITNTASAANTNSPNLYLRYLKLVCTTIPTVGASYRYAMRMDNAINKVTTAGTSIIPVNPNTATSNKTSNAYVTFGAIVCTDTTSAGVSSRLVANGQLSPAIPVVKDTYIFSFGAPIIVGDQIGTQTLGAVRVIPVPAIIIAPGWNWTLEMWQASNGAAPAFEFEGAFIERPAGQ